VKVERCFHFPYQRQPPRLNGIFANTAEIHAISILTLDRAEKTEHEDETAAADLSTNDDTPV
jgi:hypothetical protein